MHARYIFKGICGFHPGDKVQTVKTELHLGQFLALKCAVKHMLCAVRNYEICIYQIIYILRRHTVFPGICDLSDRFTFSRLCLSLRGAFRRISGGFRGGFL